MSRTGNKPLQIPDKVKVEVQGQLLKVTGPLGSQEVNLADNIAVNNDGKSISLSRSDNSRDAKRMHGLMFSLLRNSLIGVSKGFSKTLLIQGVGYRADVKGDVLNLSLGFSHPVNHPIPKGIKVAVEKQTKITVSGADKGLVGQVAADIRFYRPPEPYKGKGVRYEDEVVQRKVGKAAGGK